MSPDSWQTTQTPSQSNTVDLSIIIVSWNVWDLLRACLASIERESRPLPTLSHPSEGSARHFGPNEQPRTLEVIVVDNASDDATVDLIPTPVSYTHLTLPTKA